jgi:hypothetical protein
MVHATTQESSSSLFGSRCMIVHGGRHFCHRERRQSLSTTIMARKRHHFVAPFEFQSSSASRYCTNYSKIQCVCICVFEHTGFFGWDKLTHSTREPAKNAGNIQTDQIGRTQCARLEHPHLSGSFWDGFFQYRPF